MPYRDVHEAVTRLVEDLTARSQAKLPSERELAARLGVSRTTVRRALGDLEARGVLRRVQGRAGGAFLNDVQPAAPTPAETPDAGPQRKVERSLNRVTSIPAMLEAQGFSVGTRLVSASLEHPPHPVADFLGVDVTELVASILRVRFADGDSLSLERMYVSAARFPSLLESSLQGSLYDLFEQRFGVRVGLVEETIEAAAAPHRVAALLGLAEGDPLLRLVRRALDSDGRPFEYSVDLFRSDRTRLTVQTTNPADRVRSETSGAAERRQDRSHDRHEPARHQKWSTPRLSVTATAG